MNNNDKEPQKKRVRLARRVLKEFYRDTHIYSIIIMLSFCEPNVSCIIGLAIMITSHTIYKNDRTNEITFRVTPKTIVKKHPLTIMAVLYSVILSAYLMNFIYVVKNFSMFWNSLKFTSVLAGICLYFMYHTFNFVLCLIKVIGSNYLDTIIYLILAVAKLIACIWMLYELFSILKMLAVSDISMALFYIISVGLYQINRKLNSSTFNEYRSSWVLKFFHYTFLLTLYIRSVMWYNVIQQLNASNMTESINNT